MSLGIVSIGLQLLILIALLVCNRNNKLFYKNNKIYQKSHWKNNINNGRKW